jgi:hypothetical protein
LSEEAVSRHAGSPEAARQIRAEYPPLTTDEEAALEAAYQRVPSDLTTRLEFKLWQAK